MQLIDISKILALCLFCYGISKNVFIFDNLTWCHIFYFNQKDTSTVLFSSEMFSLIAEFLI